MKLKRNISSAPFNDFISFATGNLHGMSPKDYGDLAKLIVGVENGNGKKRLRVYIGKHAADGTYSTVSWYLNKYFRNYINDYEKHLNNGYFTIISSSEGSRNVLKAILTDIYESNLIEKPSDHTSTNGGGDNPPPNNGGGDNPPPNNGGGDNPPPTNIGGDNGSQQKNDNTMILILGVAVIAIVLIVILKKKKG